MHRLSAKLYAHSNHEQLKMRYEMRKGITVALAADDNYMPYMYVAADSIVRNLSAATSCEIVCLYLGEDIDNANRYMDPLRSEVCSVRLMEVSSCMKWDFHVSRHITLATYSRLFLPLLLPDVEKVLYIDCDVVAVSDVSELFEIDMGDNYLAAVRDMSYDTAAEVRASSECGRFPNYVNAGVLLMNLAAIRKDGIETRFIECAATGRMPMHDQSVLNICCANRITLLPEPWNFCLHNWSRNPIILPEARERCRKMIENKSYKIIHYCSPRKPWLGNCPSPLANVWWQYASLTPYYQELKKLRFSGIDWVAGMSKLIRNPRYIESAWQWLVHSCLPNLFRR